MQGPGAGGHRGTFAPDMEPSNESLHHLLTRIPYEPVPQQEITLPDRVFDPEYERETLPPELYVPAKY